MSFATWKSLRSPCAIDPASAAFAVSSRAAAHEETVLSMLHLLAPAGSPAPRLFGKWQMQCQCSAEDFAYLSAIVAAVKRRVSSGHDGGAPHLISARRRRRRARQ